MTEIALHLRSSWHELVSGAVAQVAWAELRPRVVIVELGVSGAFPDFVRAFWRGFACVLRVLVMK